MYIKKKDLEELVKKEEMNLELDRLVTHTKARLDACRSDINFLKKVSLLEGIALIILILVVL